MEKWENRSDEIKFLLNPAFCGSIIYSVITEYEKQREEPFPFLLSYLVLPLVLPQETMNNIDKTRSLYKWVESNEKNLVTFSRNASALISTTNEALEFLLQSNTVMLDDAGQLSSKNALNSLKKTIMYKSNIKEFLIKARRIGKWFSQEQEVSSVFICLGVRP